MPALRLEEDQKHLIRILRMHGPRPRSELAAALDVSPAKLTKLSQGLLSLGLVEEMDGQTGQGRGRPTVPLRISSAGGYAIGATAHKGALDIALVDYAGQVIAQSSETFHDPDPKRFAATVRSRMHALADRHSLLGSRLLGVGIGVPGPASTIDGGRWHTVETLSGWRDVPLRPIMEDILGVPVWIENDANATALAEYYLGAAHPRATTMVAILLGHGIGAGIIVDGRLLRGEMGNAGDIGAFYPMSEPRPSPIDLIGVLRADGCDIRSVADIEEKARDHRAAVDGWTVRAAGQLRRAVHSALAWFDPGEIVLSGPLPRPLLANLARQLNAEGIERGPHCDRSPEIAVSELGGGAITLGAALLPIHASVSL